MTARTRSIEWKTDLMTQAVVQYLERLLAEDSACVFRHCFEDADDSTQRRLVYRVRHYRQNSASVEFMNKRI